MKQTISINELSEALATVISKKDVSILLGGVKAPSKKDRKEKIRLRFTRLAIKEEIKNSL